MAANTLNVLKPSVNNLTTRILCASIRTSAWVVPHGGSNR